MRVAALDLGSNTSLMLIADVNGNRVTNVLADESRVTRLGQGVHANRRFHPEALARMRSCFEEYSRFIKKFACEHVIAVATSAARDASNSQELIDLAREFSIPIHIIDGEREARLTFAGALSDRASWGQMAVIDVGGGSTEIIHGDRNRVNGVSVDVGSVRLTEMFISAHPVKANELQRTREYSAQKFSEAGLGQIETGEVIAVAGTPTTLAMLDQACDFSEEKVNGYKLRLERIERWIEKLAGMSVAERESLRGMEPKRADVIVAGSLILASALRALRREELTVSTRGVRYGVALAWQEFLSR